MDKIRKRPENTSNSDDEISDNDSESNEAKNCKKKPKRKLYDVKYRKDWEQEYSSWLTKSVNQKPFCKVCQKQLQGGKRHLTRHANTKIHEQNIRKIKGSVSIKEAITKSNRYEEDYKIKEAELKLTMFLVEHNLPLLTMSHLPQLLQSVCPDSVIASKVKCSRTKTTKLFNEKIAPYAQQQLATKLQKVHFSIIIDETTDISIKKCLVILVRFYDEEQQRCKDYFLGLLELEVATAQVIFMSICNLFKELDIPITQMIGFASDNASVMMGDLNGVKAKFKEIVPNLFVMKYMSHSLHLCASKACLKLPESIERLAKDIYNYFCHSSKRKKQFEEFQEFANVQPHTLLRPCQTRWLSLHMVVDRIIEQWSALTLFFQSESLESKIPEAKLILSGLQNPVFKLYFLFLSHILAIVTKMNIEFQSEIPQIYKLMKNVTINYKMILKFYLKCDVVNNTPLHVLDPSNPHYFMKLENIYLGHAVECFLENTEISKHDINEYRLRCLDFYVILTKEIKSRIDFNDKFLTNLDMINPINIFNENKQSISLISQRFSHIFNASELENISLEWRMLSEIKLEKDIICIEKLIEFLNKQTNALGELIFNNLIKLIKIIISLPHSSAAAERLFSALALIKTKYRNCLNIETCNALLMCKQTLKNMECFNWIPPTQLVQMVLKQ